MLFTMTYGTVTRPGKHTKNYGKIHHVQWENPLFLWSFSIAMLNYQRVNPGRLGVTQTLSFQDDSLTELC